jgi:7-cyano-7-deazaguanine tRNA-ribosyltransferase
VLISITSVAQDWAIRCFPALPRRLLIDSGGYRFAIAPHEALSPKEVLARQLSLLGSAEIPTIVCARDYPILDASLDSNKKDGCITQTIAFAYELKNLVAQKGLPSYIIPMAIVQGYDVDSLGYCAHELQSIGFPLYGLGSLAVLKQHDPIIERVQTAASIVGANNLHIFGVSVAQTVRALRNMGIHSIDSARPAKSAAYNEILYSRPFRRFGILEPSLPGTPMKGRLPLERRLSTPLPCDCPVCSKNPGQIMVVGKRDNIRSRALHNYYHLKRVFCG